MRLQVVVAVLCYVTLCASASDEKDEPMVAFVCDRPSMYLTDRGWMKDDSTPCLRDPVDILNYCRKVFPNLDVRNVVESNEKVTISNWCAFGHSTCSHKFTVTPYRCLVGPFQSDALLVPEHCVFDHVHNAKLCTSFAEWNKTASRSCFTRDMELQSFSMLQPCGIDKFNGVEFVCCPRASDAGTTVKTVTTKPVKPATTAKPEEDPFSAYLNRIGGTQNGHKWNEHDYYVKAMEDMHHIHQDKLTRIMKEWAAARQHVQDMKARDPKAAEKLNKDITMRFQKTYEALEVESTLEKKQLSSLHQQRVQAELNDKKRRALDEYMLAIDDNNDPAEILRSLKHYIKAVQKDRLHTVNRYKHLRDTDPAEAEALRLDMADHLRTIDQQLNIAIGMLDRVPKYKKKVQLQIDDYLDAYHAIDTSVAVLMRSLIDNPPSTTPLPSSQDQDIERVAGQESPVDDDDDDDDDDNDGDEDEDEDEDDVDEYKDADSKYQYDDEVEDESESVEDVKVSETPERIEDKEADADEYDSEENDDEKKEIDSKENVDKKVDESEDSDEDSYESDDNDEDDVLLASTTPMSLQSPTTTTLRPLPREMDELDFIEANVEMIHGPYAAHADKSILSAKESLIQKMPVKGMNSFNAAVPLGIVIGTITVLAVIMAGVIVARRRSNQRLRTAVNVRLDPAATPEERHIATMQMNGYENPTYKYFESSGTATA